MAEIAEATLQATGHCEGSWKEEERKVKGITGDGYGSDINYFNCLRDTIGICTNI
jgi:hypothetical protein